MRPVPFTVLQNPPTIVEVQAANGQRVVLEMQLAVLQMIDLEQPNPGVPGAPMLNFQASVITKVRTAP